MLVPPWVEEQHDEPIRNYVRTGESKIVNAGSRNVRSFVFFLFCFVCLWFDVWLLLLSMLLCLFVLLLLLGRSFVDFDVFGRCLSVCVVFVYLCFFSSLFTYLCIISLFSFYFVWNNNNNRRFKLTPQSKALSSSTWGHGPHRAATAATGNILQICVCVFVCVVLCCLLCCVVLCCVVCVFSLFCV